MFHLIQEVQNYSTQHLVSKTLMTKIFRIFQEFQLLLYTLRDKYGKFHKFRKFWIFLQVSASKLDYILIFPVIPHTPGIQSIQERSGVFFLAISCYFNQSEASWTEH